MLCLQEALDKIEHKYGLKEMLMLYAETNFCGLVLNCRFCTKSEATNLDRNSIRTIT